MGEPAAEKSPLRSCLRRNRRDIGITLAQSEVLPIEEEEGFIFADRTADFGSILILRKSRPRLTKFVAKEGIRIENFVAQVLISGAVKRIASGSW